MRNTIVRNTLLVLFVFTAFAARSQNVGINTTGAAPAASAILDLSTGVTNLGFLAPQASLTSNVDNATIPAPATGLIVYNSNAAVASGKGYYYWNGALWAPISGSAGGWLLTGNSNTAPATNWIGTNDANALQFKVDAQKSGWIDYTGPFLTSLGWESANVNTGADNTAVGYKSLLLNTTGTDNTAVGYEALNKNVSGGFNTAVGSGALQVSTGSNSTAVGYDALYNNTGPNNTAVGYFSLFTNTSGQNNTAMGYNAAITSTNQNDIAAFGAFALQNNLAALNTGVGYNSGLTNTAGSQNTYIGAKADANANSYTNSTAVGYSSYIGANNVMILGSINGVNGAGADVNVGIGTITPSQKLNVQNGNILISNTTATAGQLQLQGTAAGLTTIQAGAQGATNYNYILPTTAPVGGDVLSVAAYAAPTVTLQWTAEPNALIGVKYITANTAATVFDPGTTWCVFKVLGGGGSGGGVEYKTGACCFSSLPGTGDMAGAGGGAGGYTEGFETGLTGGVSTYAVTIGLGGASPTTCGAANAGGTTTLTLTSPALTITDNGGQGGCSIEKDQSLNAFQSQIGGAGGTTGVNAGCLNIVGATGGYATITMNGIDAAESGAGANSVFQGGATGFEERDVNPIAGNNASGFGSGGGGACFAGCTSAGQKATGGAGSPGLVIIYEYR